MFDFLDKIKYESRTFFKKNYKEYKNILLQALLR